ncbi:SCO6745 family protein [Acidithrix ferrooxidans]|uniref:Uncharacterized protein n=2 Tax=root TaxID=1 RepID=A0A0D8HFA5_9ACTN|nr:hypothetical protein [Acidithrix ferrooxidans]KJF16603.1 hypothetical protein AXFE_25710 [Acidithrix ferrooxidans]
MENLANARRFYKAYELAHAGIYFYDPAHQYYKQAGVSSRFMGYFASRVAGMGAVTAPVVTSSFYSFSPSAIENFIPLAWSLTTPGAMIEARLKAAGEMLAVPCQSLGDEVDYLIEKLEPISKTLPLYGRPLFAGHLSIELSSDRPTRLWQLITLFREHRGDNHINCLVRAQISGIEANYLHFLDGRIPREFLTRSRGFSDQEWDDALQVLITRGLVAKDGQSLTTEGKSLKASIEDETDALSNQGPAQLADDTERVIETLQKLSKLVKETHSLPI